MPGKEINNCNQIEEAFPQGDVGDISRPDLIDRRDLIEINQARMFRDNQVGRSTTSTLAGEVSAGDPGANAQVPGDASTTDESPTQLVHGQTTIGQKPGGFCGGGGFLSAQCPPH